MKRSLDGDADMRIGLGLDTGGTYTDAVIMDLEKGEVLSKAKSMTTYEDLTIGIEGAIDRLDQSLLGSLGVVALSSTLATNSVVEGKGCRVGLICIGGEYDRTLSADYMISVRGGNDIHGDELEPLDIKKAEEFMRSIVGKVEGLAISGYLSVRNPAQEKRLKEMAREILDVPVVCGYELTSELGFNERTTTCIMNSRLIPIMDELIRSVRKALDERGIRAPLMISRGDGSMMTDAVACERPVETILSGPAASLMGAMHMTGIRDAVVMDMGGTTTDIGILRGGHPSLDREGAIIDGKRTRVMAARVYTSGIGGDSRIVVNPGNVILTPQRVIPLCVAAYRWPEVAEGVRTLTRKLPHNLTRPLSRPDLQNFDYEYFHTVKDPSRSFVMGEYDEMFLRLAKERPVTLKIATMELGCNTYDIQIQRMEELGLRQRVGITPTDILHVEGSYREFDSTASEIGVRYLASLVGANVDQFVTIAKRAIRNKLCVELMKALITEDSGEPNLGTTGMDLLMKGITSRPGKDFGCSITLSKPIIGIGAPSGVYMRWVGEALNTDVMISVDSDVGNAIGAVCASISESVKYVIRPMVPRREGAVYEVFSKMGRKWFATLEEAMESSESEARDYVMGEALKNNADVVEITVDLDRKPYIYVPGEGRLDEVTMVVTAAGKPRMF